MDREYPKILPDPQSCSMQTYGMEQGTLVMEGSKDTILPMYIHRQQVQRGFYPRACVWGASSLYCGSEDRTQKAHVEWLAWSQALNQLKNRSILQFSISNTFRSQSGQQKYVTERA